MHDIPLDFNDSRNKTKIGIFTAAVSCRDRIRDEFDQGKHHCSQVRRTRVSSIYFKKRIAVSGCYNNISLVVVIIVTPIDLLSSYVLK